MSPGAAVAPAPARATVKPFADSETGARALAVFSDIRTTCTTDFVNGFWRGLAFNPTVLEFTWAEVKRQMAAHAWPG